MKWWDRARREERDPSAARPRPARHGRHGRLGRSPITKPPLPAVGSRFDRFDVTVTSTADYLRATWPELRDVRFEVAGMPRHDAGGDVPRWAIDRDAGRILIYRVAVERMSKAHGVPMHQADEFHRRVLVEGAVFRAAAEYLGREPWDLGADPFH
ncbi:hypothetical protein [Microbacterium sp. G2-8]|uniref:hypothetical protein n=1 Tax=Microbacterium sp. G2-8 TaxID=2842454 RepID=UPI001C8AC992|nr:hypothetical protein [Microbacterium sp. G2-8]